MHCGRFLRLANTGGGMGIDKRVAHGIAGRHVKDALNDSIRVLRRIRAATSKRPARPGTWKGARRELHDIRHEVARHSLWWREGEDRHDGPYLVWLGAYGDADGELGLVRHRLAPAATRSLSMQSGIAGFLSLHAVARCLQRNGTLSWAEIKPVLADAAANLLLMSDVARVQGLRQIPVMAGSGLFVGDFKAEGNSTMETYLMLDEGQVSRWIPVRETLVRAVKSAGLEPGDGCAAACYVHCPAKIRAEEEIGQALASFRWLREEYNPKLDPLSVAWKDYATKVA
jgi:hypothetical protein